MPEPDAALSEFLQSRSTSARNKLAEQCLPLVKQCSRAANKRIGRSIRARVALDDLEQAGAIAMVTAIEKFDPAQNVPLEPYLVQRIQWAITDVISKTAAELKRAPGLISLEDAGDLPGPDSQPEPKADAKIMMENLCRGLSADEQTILTLRYSNGLSFAEIGLRMNRSRAGVQKIHQAVMARLRLQLPEDDVFGRRTLRQLAKADDSTDNTHSAPDELTVPPG
jgi:RNA polymerase sigma factor (sigma-70 family)